MARTIKQWWSEEVVQKYNIAQEQIVYVEGQNKPTDTNRYLYGKSFNALESVNRGVSMIVNACSSFDFDIQDKRMTGVVPGMRKVGLENLLMYRPNPYQSIQEFRKNMYSDFILEGNAFIYWDGAFLYNIPASQMDIITDPKTFIKGYIYNGSTHFTPDEIMHFKDISADSIYRGTTRLTSAASSINTLYEMGTFQQSFFTNNAVPGLVFTTENTLSSIAKKKTVDAWMAAYSSTNGARKPMIVDSGLKPSNIFQTSFQELDFSTSIKDINTKIYSALGVPSVLIEGGNNANISPNLRLFYLETVLPIVKSFCSAIERQFGYDVEPIVEGVSAIQPELKDISSFLSTLTNTGIITQNEARTKLRYPLDTDPESNKLHLPQNIAGSSANPSVGGKPPTEPKK